ncbi:glycoside hydrolase family 3 N-terminal domain-containing protein [Chitinibacter sp. FCG-7]|uniref:beta-N-acetylhexosaminidase n=1 Tax=Chitinibacter mangrovi TaxID=3153927 RepID=A0AAU7F6S3_9NEIS
MNLTLFTSAVLLLLVWRYRPTGWQLSAALSIFALLFTSNWLGQLQWHRHQILQASPAQAQLISTHLIVGYTDEDELLPLIQQGLIGGVFITKRNITQQDGTAISQMIQRWQDLRQAQHLPPLVIATDQEGGLVSRLSPPLPFQPALGSLLQNSSNVRETALEYARQQGRGLAQLGITLNLAPVVDLDHGVENPADRYSKISRRALSSNPQQVALAAQAYCKGLAESRVQCTLKHFPGLGRVFEDTHTDSAIIHTPLAELEKTDLLPFRTLQNSSALFMLSHAKVAALDERFPTSSSPAIIQQLLRQQWQYQGLLITDDMGMAGAGDIESAAVRSLNAGADYLLISWDPARFYPVFHALLAAHEQNKLDLAQLSASRARINQRQGALH